jgi:hypothetical protein
MHPADGLAVRAACGPIDRMRALRDPTTGQRMLRQPAGMSIATCHSGSA